MTKADRIAAVIPAFNEEKTVGAVVRAFKACPLIGEIIVVDDGSTDRTEEEAVRAGADAVLKLPENVGKGEALRQGAAATTAGILFFCDADLLGLSPENVAEIAKPVIEGRYVMCTGLRDRGPLLTRLIAHLPLISGERALKRSVIEGVPPRFLQGFRIEIALNYFCRANGLPYGSVPTRGVRNFRKMEKVGFLRGLAGYLEMIRQIAEAMVLVRLEHKKFEIRSTKLEGNSNS